MKFFVTRISLVLLFAAACAFADTNRTSVLVVYDSDDSYALPCFEQIVVTLEYNRIPYTTYNLAGTTSLPELDAYFSVITATEMLWKLDADACDRLNGYVQDGGGLAVLYRGWNLNLHTLLGMTATTPPVTAEKKSKGLVFVRELIPGIARTTISGSILADISAYDVQLTPSASVFATTTVDHHPAAWVNTVGRGKVVFWNSVILSEKIYRGLIMPSLGAVQPFTLSPILNIGVICLDDFPNASPNVKIEPVQTEFNMTVSEFYAFRWYPDMLKLAKQYGLHFTAGLIFSYAESTNPPYKFSEWVSSTVERGGKTVNSSVWLAREARKDIEIAFHGHNHQPLTLKRWGTIDNMRLSLAAAKARWQYDNLGPSPLSYIPPMNIIDSVGMSAMSTTFPSIRVVGGQYMGKFALGQNREFGTEPWNPRIKSIPRVTSGFIYDDFNKFLTLSLLHTVGAWTHFVHPDDIIPTAGRYAENTRDDLSADNLSWRGDPKKTGIYYSFERWIAFVHLYYPWLEYTDYAHAYDKVARYESSAIVVRSAGRQVSVRVNVAPNYFTLHLNSGNAIVSCAGGEVIQSNTLAFSTYYVIRALKNDLMISLRDSIPPMLYRAGTPTHLYLAGDSRYSASNIAQTQYPTLNASLAPFHSSPSHGPNGSTKVHASARPALQVALPHSSRALVGNEGVLPDSVAFQKLIDAQRLAVLKSPLDVKAWKHLRASYTSRGMSAEALECDEHLVQLMPNDTAGAKALAREYVAQDKKEKAIPIYEHVLARYPNDAVTWHELYQIYLWSERPADAMRALSRYVGAVPADDASMRTLAELYVGNERQLEAIPLYETLTARAPGDRSLRTMLARLYGWNNFHEKAAHEFARLYENNAADTASAMRAADEYQAAGRTNEAGHIVEDVSRRNPHDIQMLKRLGEIYLWQDRQGEAIKVYERLIKAEPDSLSWRLALARLYMWNKRPHDASAEGKRILKREPSNLDALRMVAESDRADDKWFDARAWYGTIADRQPHDKDAREYLDAVRRDHGLRFTSAYEWVDDSNNLTREELPVSVEIFQSHTADYFLRLNAHRVRDNRRSPLASAPAAGLSENGYGAGMGARFSLGRRTAFSLAAIASQYDSNWTPVSAFAAFEHSFTDRFSLTLRLERSETVEGIQAIRRRLYTTSARGELFLQATDRWSIGALGEVESYTDNNTRSTGEILTTYKIVLLQPQISLQASSIYQDTKRIYPSSEPYWTPRQLFTSSIGASIAYTFFGFFTAEIAETGTVQGGIFSNNIGAKAAIDLSQFLQFTAEYGQLGSSVYRQTIARASLNYRY